MKKIAILGSTGSIGTQTLEVVRANKDIEVTALAAGSNIDLLEKQIREFSPKIAAVWNEEKAKELKDRVRDLDIRVESGMDGLLAVATELGAEIVVTAVVGMIGIRPTIAAMNAGKDIALANKETLVTAGHIIMSLAKEKHVRILPVDSEHSAIFQSLNGETGNKIHKILLTASGGPFRGWTREQMKGVQVEDALKHPNWTMGRKITIDSSTMVNKGLEVMEARWLFGVEMDQVQVVVQPQSVIHSMVEYEDGAVIAQLGTPDMILLPGTKSTIADLRWLRQSGLEAAILKAADAGTLIFGVCGGYQMLGRTVSDPEQVEAAGVTEISGMGLLDMDTKFRGEKVQTQTQGVISGVEGMLSPLNGLAYEGYEIHMGRSRQEMPALSGGGNVYGSYVHGIFDAPGIADTILRVLCARKGVSFDALATFDASGYKERQYDLLADVVRGGLDMSFVYRVLRREV